MDKPTVLVIDDNAPLREFLRVALVADGWAVREAGDGWSALDQARTCAPDVVLLDLLLPGVDGLTLLEMLRELPGWAERPIVAVSGWGAKVADARAGSSRHRLPRQAVRPPGSQPDGEPLPPGGGLSAEGPGVADPAHPASIHVTMTSEWIA